MKVHIGIGSRAMLLHSVVATSSNGRDTQILSDLPRGEETRVWGDSAYAGQGRAVTDYAPPVRLTCSEYCPYYRLVAC